MLLPTHPGSALGPALRPCSQMTILPALFKLHRIGISPRRGHRWLDMRAAAAAEQDFLDHKPTSNHQNPDSAGSDMEEEQQPEQEEAAGTSSAAAAAGASPLAAAASEAAPSVATGASAGAAPPAAAAAAPGAPSAQAKAAALTSHPISVEQDYFGAEELAQELSDSKAFGQRGEALVLAQVAICLLVAFPPIPLQGLVDLFGTLALTAGTVFILYALLSLGRSISPLPQPRKKHKLVVTGMYSYSRHPMYGGLLLAGVGLAAVTHSEIRLAMCGLLWYILEQKVRFEERELSARYPEYAEYIVKVKKFVPFVY